MILPIAEEKGLGVQLVHPVPERRVGQARALSRVLLNLATNAVKFTDTGFVELAARPIDSRRLEFSVRDTGVGIDPLVLRGSHQAVRAASAGGRHQVLSSRLGLALCRKLVKALGAELEVETRPDLGSRFYFEVDCPPASAAP